MAVTRLVDARRRRVVAMLGAATLGAAVPLRGARAQGPELFPGKPVVLWVPWPAGGATDLTMRVLAEGASHHLGVKVVVDNRSGAGGTLVMPILQQAAPDGYTIAQIPQPVFRAPWTQKVQWDPIRDTTPILQISGVTFGIVVPTASPFRSLNDLFAFARANPGQLSVSTNGAGTTPHLVMEELFGKRQLTYIHVPYKGTAEQMVAVASGQVMVGVNSNGFAPHVESGKLRLLVTFGARRSKRWPNVPTLRDLGHGIVANSPYGLAGPRGLPAPIVQVLHDAFKAAMFEPAHMAELDRYEQEPAYLGPEEYGKAMRDAYAAEKRNVERLGLARPAS